MKNFCEIFKKRPKNVGLMVTKVYRINDKLIYSNSVKELSKEAYSLKKKTRTRWELSFEYDPSCFEDGNAVEVMVYPKIEV